MRSLVPLALLLAGLLAADATNNDARVGRMLAGRVVAVGQSANYLVVKATHDSHRF